MEKDQSPIIESILHLTLEIIYLITRETPPSAPGDYVTIKLPPPGSLVTKPNTKQKILEVAHKITQLLTGELLIRCEDVAVYFSMEEWECLEEHKELYKDAMMEGQQLLPPLDGSSSKNTPERSPRPLYSQDSTQEDSTQEVTPHHYQNEELMMIKVEVKEEAEETELNGDERWVQELIADEQHERNDVKHHRTVLPEGGTEEDDLTADNPKGNWIAPSLGLPLNGDNLSSDPATHEEHSKHWIFLGNNHTITSSHTLEKTRSEPELTANERIVLNTKPYVCPQCGKCFSYKCRLVSHEKTHTGEKPYSCSECGKSFCDQSALTRHRKCHTRVKPHLCLDCGKCLTKKPALLREDQNSCWEQGNVFFDQSVLLGHKTVHTGMESYSCSECGKGFTREVGPVADKARVKPYSCADCGRCFSYKSELIRHERAHTGEKPYACSKCGKCFSFKSSLTVHERLHIGEKPYSCSECGKRFSNKAHLATHGRTHTGEKPYACSECERSFCDQSALIKHRKLHTGVKPLSCSDRGKCTQKSDLPEHVKVCIV